mgnify:CR=1 FL=1
MEHHLLADARDEELSHPARSAELHPLDPGLIGRDEPHQVEGATQDPPLDRCGPHADELDALGEDRDRIDGGHGFTRGPRTAHLGVRDSLERHPADRALAGTIRDHARMHGAAIPGLPHGGAVSAHAPYAAP